MKISSRKPFEIDGTKISAHKQRGKFFEQEVPTSLLLVEYFMLCVLSGFIKLVEVPQSEVEHIFDEANFRGFGNKEQDEEFGKLIEAALVDSDGAFDIDEDIDEPPADEIPPLGKDSNGDEVTTAALPLDDDIDDVDITKIKAEDAVKFIKEVSDIEKLYSMLANEKRKTVLEAIEKQIESLEQA